jgi:hypothetical protein
VRESSNDPRDGGAIVRILAYNLSVVGAVTGLLLLLLPSHAFAVALAVVAAWIVLQLVCAFAFMAALYKGDIVEYRSTPRSYAVARRSLVGWRARHFMQSYLRLAPDPQTGLRRTSLE